MKERTNWIELNWKFKTKTADCSIHSEIRDKIELKQRRQPEKKFTSGNNIEFANFRIQSTQLVSFCGIFFICIHFIWNSVFFVLFSYRSHKLAGKNTVFTNPFFEYYFTSAKNYHRINDKTLSKVNVCWAMLVVVYQEMASKLFDNCNIHVCKYVIPLLLFRVDNRKGTSEQASESEGEKKTRN